MVALDRGVCEFVCFSQNGREQWRNVSVPGGRFL